MSTKKHMDFEKVKTHFLSNLETGVVLTFKQLKSFCKKQKLKVGDTPLRRIRRLWKFTGIFDTIKRKPRYMSASILKYGTLMLDIGFLTQYKSHNRNYIGFVAAKELVSGAIGAVPVRSKSLPEVYGAVKQLLMRGNFRFCHTLVFDQESAVKSPKFQKQLFDEMGVRTFFLKARSKAYLAELAVSYIKKRIGYKISYTGNKTWIGNVLESIIDNYNEQIVPGTRFKRRAISRKNSLDFLAQKFKIDNPSLLFNAATLHSSNISSSKWKNKIFKFDIGDKVLLSKKVNYHDKQLRKKKTKQEDPAFSLMTPKYVASKQFLKPSLDGSYTNRVYTIKNRYLKSNAAFFWSIVYELNEISGRWYQSYDPLYIILI